MLESGIAGTLSNNDSRQRITKIRLCTSKQYNTVVLALMMMVTTMHRIRAISASLLWMKVAKAAFLLAGSSTTGSSQRRTHTFESVSHFTRSRRRCTFLAIGATSPNVGGSVFVVYQTIGRTLHRR